MRQLNRPVVLSIAGYDPSGGAGLLADIKTFEQHKVYGLGIVSALTFQTEKKFFSLEWISENEARNQLKTYLDHYPVRVVKFGLAKNWKIVGKLAEMIKAHSKRIQIIVDPILKSSSGFSIIKKEDRKGFQSLLKKIDLLTPNADEANVLSGEKDYRDAGISLSDYCNVLIKGGHNREKKGTDFLFANCKIDEIKPNVKQVWPKHGSGCVLSAAIAANLALGKNIKEACVFGKRYAEKVLCSNNSLLGYHI